MRRAIFAMLSFAAAVLVQSCFVAEAVAAAPVLSFKLAEENPRQPGLPTYVTQNGKTVYVHNEEILSDNDIVEVSISEHPASDGTPIRYLTLTIRKDKIRFFRRFTEANVLNYLVFYVDGVPKACPQMHETITGGVIELGTGLPEEDKTRLLRKGTETR